MSLIRHYKFDGNCLDEVSGQHGTPTGVDFVDGIVGQAAEFLTDGDHVAIPPVTDTDFSCSFWFYTDIAYDDNSGILLGTSDPIDRFIHKADTNALSTRVSNVNYWGNYYYMEYNKWIHVAGVFSRSTGLSKIYVDGIVVLTEPFISSDDLYYIGGDSTLHACNGRITELKIYDHALAQTEINGLLHYGLQQRMRQQELEIFTEVVETLPAVTRGVIHHYPFRSGNAFDVIGGNNAGLKSVTIRDYNTESEKNLLELLNFDWKDPTNLYWTPLDAVTKGGYVEWDETENALKFTGGVSIYFYTADQTNGHIYVNTDRSYKISASLKLVTAHPTTTEYANGGFTCYDKDKGGAAQYSWGAWAGVTPPLGDWVHVEGTITGEHNTTASMFQIGTNYIVLRLYFNYSTTGYDATKAVTLMKDLSISYTDAAPTDIDIKEDSIGLYQIAANELSEEGYTYLYTTGVYTETLDYEGWHIIHVTNTGTNGLLCRVIPVVYPTTGTYTTSIEIENLGGEHFTAGYMSASAGSGLMTKVPGTNRWEWTAALTTGQYVSIYFITTSGLGSNVPCDCKFRWRNAQVELNTYYSTSYRHPSYNRTTSAQLRLPVNKDPINVEGTVVFDFIPRISYEASLIDMVSQQIGSAGGRMLIMRKNGGATLPDRLFIADGTLGWLYADVIAKADTRNQAIWAWKEGEGYTLYFNGEIVQTSAIFNTNTANYDNFILDRNMDVLELTVGTQRITDEEALIFWNQIPQPTTLEGMQSHNFDIGPIRNNDISTYVEATDVINCTVTENCNIEKTSGGLGWNAGVRSVQVIHNDAPQYGHTGKCFVEFTVEQTDNAIMAGLGHSTNTASFDTIDFALSVTSLGIVNIYSNGAAVASSIATYAAGDTFRVEVRFVTNDYVDFYQNGELIYSYETVPVPNYYFDCSFYAEGGKLSNVIISSRDAQYFPLSDQIPRDFYNFVTPPTTLNLVPGNGEY